MTKRYLCGYDGAENPAACDWKNQQKLQRDGPMRYGGCDLKHGENSGHPPLRQPSILIGPTPFNCAGQRLGHAHNVTASDEASRRAV